MNTTAFTRSHDITIKLIPSHPYLAIIRAGVGAYRHLWKQTVPLVSQVLNKLIGLDYTHKISKPPSPPLFLILKNHINLVYHKVTLESILYTLQNSKNPKCLNIFPATTTSTPLILLILLTICGITVRWLTRGRKFWPGYLH